MSTLILLKSYVLKDLGVDIKEANFFPHFLWDELDLVPLFFLWSCLFFPSSIFVFMLFLDTICQILFMQHDVLKYVCILEWLIQANQHRDCLTDQFFDENTKKFTLSFQDSHCYYLQLSCCTLEHISPTSPKFCVLWPITFSPAYVSWMPSLTTHMPVVAYFSFAFLILSENGLDYGSFFCYKYVQICFWKLNILKSIVYDGFFPVKQQRTVDVYFYESDMKEHLKKAYKFLVEALKATSYKWMNLLFSLWKIEKMLQAVLNVRFGITLWVLQRFCRRNPVVSLDEK